VNLEWLMDHSGPIIRWRTANELFTNFAKTNRSTLIKELLDTPLAQTWLYRLTLGDFSTSLDALDENSFKR